MEGFERCWQPLCTQPSLVALTVSISHSCHGQDGGRTLFCYIFLNRVTMFDMIPSVVKTNYNFKTIAQLNKIKEGRRVRNKFRNPYF